MNLIDIAINGHKPMPMNLRPFLTVLKNDTNEMNVVTGPTFQQIELISNITDPTKITKVMVELNGESIVDVSGSELVKLAAYKKRSRAAGRYVIPFGDASAKTIDGRRMGELVTLPSDTLTVYVTFGDTGATAPTLRARAQVTPSQPKRYFVPKLDSTNDTAPSDGENIWQYTNRSPVHFIRRLHFISADISHLKVFRDDLKVFEADTADNNEDLKEGSEFVPQAGWFHFDPAQTGYLLQGLFPTIAKQSLDFKYNIASAGSIKVIRETITQVASTDTQAA